MSQSKPHVARTTTYLHFPGTAEEAFMYYKAVFGTELTGRGIQRFGDLPVQEGKDPMPASVAKQVVHIQLPLLGNHQLMASDAPAELGRELKQGNNMFINLEPETKAETKRLYDALSHNGTIIMPLRDMFFGVYFGTCTDQFGVNWMFNCIEN